MDNLGIKNEFFTDYDTVPCCHACLSTGRRLSTVTDYVDIYYKVCCDQFMKPPTNVYLCWECTALLKRLRIFSKKAAEAQRILQFYYVNKQDPFPPSLSSLNVCPSDDTQIHFTHEEKEIKPIKQETEHSNFEDDIDNFDYTDNVKDEPDDNRNLESTEIDIEDTKIDVPNSKSNWEEYNLKRIIKRNAKYRFVNTKLKKHRRLLIRKIPVKLNDVLAGLEEERCDVMFLKEQYRCVSCVAAWKDEDGLAKHNVKCHDKSIGCHQCRICHIRFPSQDKLHVHESKQYFRRECKVCNTQFYSQGRMDVHLERHNRMVQCLVCELCFKNVRLFYKHYKALHGVFVCDVCGKRCKTRDMIERHLRYHFGYECPYCKRILKNSSSYKNHVETQHLTSVSEEAYCVQCDRKFTSNRMYKRHLQASAAHATERDNTRVKRQYPCPECSNVYSRRTYMNNHYRHVHKKQSKYYCVDCDRHFLNRTRYADHRRFQHEGVKKDKDKLCNICGRGFAANRTLINHIRTHSGERPFACEFCGAKFTQKHAMLSHVKYIHMKSKRQPRLFDTDQGR